MLAPLRNVDGLETLPAITFTAETGTGFWRDAPGVLALSILGVKVAEWTAAGYLGPLPGLSDTADPLKGDALVGVKQPFTGAVARTQHQKNADYIHVADFGASPSASPSVNRAAIQKAIDAMYLQRGGEVHFDIGVYQIDGLLEIPQRVLLVGAGRGFINPYISGQAAPRGTALFLVAGSNVGMVRIRCRLTNSAGTLIETDIGDRNQDARHFGGMVNMLLWGNRSATASPPTTSDLNTNSDGISIEGSRYVVLQNVLVMYCGGDGYRAGSFDYGAGSITTNNLKFDQLDSLQNAARGFNLAFGDSSFSDLVAGNNGTDGFALVGSYTWNGGASWNNLRNGVTCSGATANSIAVINGVSAYDNDSNGFVVGTTAGKAPLIAGCVSRGNGRNSGSVVYPAVDRANFKATSAADGWGFVGCSALARDQTGVDTAQYGFFIQNPTFAGSLDGSHSEGAVVNNFSIQDPSNITSHGMNGASAQALAHPPLRLAMLTNAPGTPDANAECNVYMKGNKFVVQHNDGVTTTYRWLDFTVANATWVYSLVAP
jgi:hypothetical protein